MEGAATKPALVVITGPTASGKTALAVAMARRFGTGVISADSRQLYRELRIGTARPSPGEMAGVPHYLTGVLSIEKEFNASLFEAAVLELLEGLFERHPVVVMAGGSMLYIDAVCRGIDDLPAADRALREGLTARLESEGLESLRFELRRLDPDYYRRADLRNPKRILHALEICLQTGRPYSSHLRNAPRERPFAILKAGLNPPRNLLYERINRRVEEMVAAGLEEEVRSLLPYRSLNALQTVGYREWFPYFDGLIPRGEVIRQIQSNSRRYARKQLTWLRRDPEIRWFDGGDPGEIIAWAEQSLAGRSSLPAS